MGPEDCQEKIAFIVENSHLPTHTHTKIHDFNKIKEHNTLHSKYVISKIALGWKTELLVKR